jgi:hypothetical protein
MTGSDPKQSSEAPIAAEVTARIERSVVLLRGQRVLLDETLAELYGVPVKALNQAVKRNIERFPDDFMFQLTSDEGANLRSQTVTSRTAGHGGRRSEPYAFTEQGVAMLSSVLRSEQAVRVNIEIMRAFVRMRRVMQEHAELAKKLSQLERQSRWFPSRERRRAVPAGVRRDPRPDDAAGKAEGAHWVQGRGRGVSRGAGAW